MNDDIARLRRSYERGELDVASADADPFAQFGAWLNEALAAEIPEANAMTLATVGADGRPAARIVLLRGWDARGFVFFTNYDSRKGRDIAVCGHVALLFFWQPLERQIRIEGQVERLAADESDAYFAQRPRGHRLSAWASRQSAPVADRATLEAQMVAMDARFGTGEVPRPEYWGGYRVVAEHFEFWQGRRNRVHDRIAYDGSGATWSRVRLSP